MKTYNAHQFLNTREPYEYLYKMKNDPLRHEQALTAMKENAHAVGVKNFNRMYQNYVMSVSYAYKIVGPNCGRDENGVFHCVCGMCRPLRKQSENRGYGSNDSRNSGDDTDSCI